MALRKIEAITDALEEELQSAGSRNPPEVSTSASMTASLGAVSPVAAYEQAANDAKSALVRSCAVICEHLRDVEETVKQAQALVHQRIAHARMEIDGLTSMARDLHERGREMRTFITSERSRLARLVDAKVTD